MTIYGDVVQIAATTAGVAGDIKVSQGARLLGLNLSCTNTAIVAISKINVQWPGLTQPWSFVPNIITSTTTNGISLGSCPTPLINLSKLPPVQGQNTVTVTVTTSANLTMVVGLIWEAA
jgi:hypothetical protein